MDPATATLILYLAGTGMTFKPVRVKLPTHAACEVMASKARERGHRAHCWRPHRIPTCATCGAPVPPIG